jgi:hypothetical protein
MIAVVGDGTKHLQPSCSHCRYSLFCPVFRWRVFSCEWTSWNSLHITRRRMDKRPTPTGDNRLHNLKSQHGQKGMLAISKKHCLSVEDNGNTLECEFGSEHIPGLRQNCLLDENVGGNVAYRHNDAMVAIISPEGIGDRSSMLD